jgi:hypothetical protein
MQRLEENLSGEAQRLHEEQHTSLVAAEGTAQEDTDAHHARADIYATAAASLAGWAGLGADGAPLNEINEERHAATSAALHKPEEQKASNAAADYTSAKESTGTSARSSGSTRIQTPALSSDPDFEPMIAAIVGEARGKRGERFYQVVQSIIIPDTVEELRAVRGRKTLSKLRQDLDESDRDESDDNGDELGPMVSPADAGVKAEAFRSTQLLLFSGWGTRHKGQASVKAKHIKPILLTPARRQEREAALSADEGTGQPRRRVHFKIARNRAISTLHPLEPGSRVVRIWLQAMLLPTTWEMWSFPFRLGFGDITAGVNLWVLKGDLAADVMFLLDIMAGFMIIVPVSTFPGQECAATTFKEIISLRVRHSLHWQLFPILVYQLTSLALVLGGWKGPAGGAATASGALILWWASGVPRLVQRVRRFSISFDGFLVDPAINAKQLQASRVALIILLSAHWVGSVLYFLARLQVFASTTWLADFEHLLPDYEMKTANVSIDYLLCMYKGFNALSNLGYDLGIPSNETEMCFALLVMLAQVYISALILGTLLNYLVRRDPLEEAHKQQLINVCLFMDQKNIPSELYSRIIDYYSFQAEILKRQCPGKLTRLCNSL